MSYMLLVFCFFFISQCVRNKLTIAISINENLKEIIMVTPGFCSNNFFFHLLHPLKQFLHLYAVPYHLKYLTNFGGKPEYIHSLDLFVSHLHKN